MRSLPLLLTVFDSVSGDFIREFLPVNFLAERETDEDTNNLEDYNKCQDVGSSVGVTINTVQHMIKAALLESRVTFFRLAIVDIFWLRIFPAYNGLKILI